MKLRNSISALMIICIAIFAVTSCLSINETDKHQNYSTVIIPYSYSFTNNQAGKNHIDIKCFLENDKGKYTNKQNYASIEIISGDLSFLADWDGEIVVESESSVNYQGLDLFSCTLPISFFQSSGIEMAESYLKIEWVNGSSESIYLGDISFLLAGQSELLNSPILSAIINPVGRINSQGLYELSAISLELNLVADIVLSNIDLGLSNYGIDSANIKVFRDDEISDIQQALENKTIFDDFNLALKIMPQDSITTNVGNLELGKGKNLLIVPLTSVLSNVSISNTGARLVFLSNEIEYSKIISDKKMFDQVLFSEKALESVIRQ